MHELGYGTAGGCVGSATRLPMQFSPAPMDPSPRCVVVVVWVRRWIMHYVSSIAYTGDWMRRIHEQGASTHPFEPPVRWGKGRRRRAGDHVLPEQQKAFEIATGGSPIKERSAQL